MCAGGGYADIPMDQACVDGNLVTAPALAGASGLARAIPGGARHRDPAIRFSGRAACLEPAKQVLFRQGPDPIEKPSDLLSGAVGMYPDRPPANRRKPRNTLGCVNRQ